MGDELTSAPTFRLTQSDALRDPSDTPTPGTILGGRFRIVALLGRGGMGEVYLAEDLRLGQKVALKFLSARNPAELRRLYREVRLGRQIAHPNVCRLYDLVEIEQQQFLSMEHVEGEDLASLLRRVERLPRERALRISKDICAGLQAIHDAGVLHRDLKPANILLDARGHAHISDFGIASLVEETFDSGSVAGTPAYMAPEALQRVRPGIRSDLYALGVVLYELFTGRLPFEAHSFEEILASRETASVAPPSDVAPDIDPAIDRIILQCLARDPARRPASAQAVASALPGADPLQIALAAGETPSRAMVAEAATFRGFAASTLAAITVAVLTGIVAILFLGRDTTLFGRAKPLPREKLAATARAWVPAVPNASLRYHAAWFELDDVMLESIRARGATRQIGSTSHSPILYVTRFSPDPLVPRAGMSSDRPPRVTLDDPPHDVDGMATIVLDGMGNLREIRSPQRRRPERARVEARSETIAESVQLVVIAIVAITGILLVRRNLRRGRGDRVGAFRFATALFVLSCLDALAGATAWRSSVIGLWWLLAGIVAHALFWSALMWIAYLALEPIVRRHWPQTLAGWTRLFDGRFFDPLVGRDIVAGAAGGVLLALLRHLMVILPARLGTADPLPLLTGIDDLAGVGTALSTVFFRAHTAMFNAVGSLVTFVLLRLLVRNFAVATLLWIPLIVIINFGSRTDVVSIALLVVFTVTMLLLLNRYGLLALAVALFVSFNLRGVLPALSMGDYLLPASVALIVALAVYAFGAGIAVRRTARSGVEISAFPY